MKIKNKKINLNISNNSIKFIIAYFSIISALELLAFGVGGSFSAMAAYIWLFSGIVLVGYSLYTLCKKIVEDIKNKNFFVLGGFMLLIILLFILIGNVSLSDINPDAAQQAAAGLDSFNEADLNYTKTAFLGYPNRQYVIAAIPALILGRSIWTLHLGFGLMFLIGLSVMFITLREWLAQQEITEEYALLPCFALLAFPFITEYFMNFEQAITPVSLTMLGIGLFLRLLMHTDIISVVSISYVGCLLADSYTPAIASAGLLVVFLAIFILKLKSPKIGDILLPYSFDKSSSKTPLDINTVSVAIAGSIANILVFFTVTFIAGRSDRINEFRESTSLIKTAFSSWKEFFTDANARFLGIFCGIILLYMLLSFTFRLKVTDCLISLWVLGVVFFSDYMIGYTSYEKSWIIQRNIIIIPVLLIFVFFAIIRILKKYRLTISKPVLIIVSLFFFAAGIFNISQPHRSFKYFSYIQPMKYAIDYIEDTLDENGLSVTDEFNLVIYTDNILQSNIHDYAKFFFPNAVTYSESGNVYDSTIDLSKPTLFFAEDERLRTLEPDDMGSDDYIQFLQTSMDSKTFKNFRYDTEITWYRKLIKQ